MSPQLYGIVLLKAGLLIISLSLKGTVVQFATIEVSVPTPLKPFQINGGTVTKK